MLKEFERRPLSARDHAVFEALVPRDHYLRRALEVIDFQQLREQLTGFYSTDHGRPAEEPVLMLKLYFLQYHDNLSDGKVMQRAQTDVAYRLFLELSLEQTLPDPSTLCYFRGRLGVEGHRAILDEVVAQARRYGLVKDRLRIKDATHLIANVAVPTTLALLAQTRDRLLVAAQPFDTLRVEGERAQIETVRRSIESFSDCERLAARIAHLQEILAWVDALPSPPGGETNRAWQRLVDVRQVAHRILADQADPQAGDRTRSVVDPDARRGKHGDYYDGYLLDILIDADSELITQINVLPANGDEAADAPELIRREEQAHGNDIEQLSIDGIGFNGPVLRELADPSGLALHVCVPPKADACNGRFSPDDFVEDVQQGVVTCPAGEASRYRQRDAKNQTTIYRFTCETCRGCALLNQCMAKPPGHFGRTVRKNDYQAEYQRAREKAATPQYTQTRKEHPKVERKLSELTLRHGVRRARSRGHPRVLWQGLITAVVTNVKRIVRLLSAPNTAAAYG